MSDLKLANLDQKSMVEIEELELKLGVNLIAYKVENNEYADLNDENILKLNELEKKLGVILLAYPLDKVA